MGAAKPITVAAGLIPEIHLSQTEVPDNLIDAYRSARYRAGTGSNALTLHIDQYSEPLSRLFAASGHRCAAFITACNPLGRLQSPEENLAACAHLLDKLRQLVRADQIIEGKGYDPVGVWPGEKSFLVLGLSLETSRMLGKEFRQNAMVWIGENAVPRLILLC